MRKLKPYLITDSDSPMKANILAQADSYYDAMKHEVGGYIMSSSSYLHARSHKTCPTCLGKGEVKRRKA